MFRDFYGTAAQVLPVVILAFVWESRFLDRLRSERRPTRRIDPTGVLFWTKRRVRIYTLTVVLSMVAGMAVTMLVLSGMIGDHAVLRYAVACCVLLAVGTLGFRMTVDVVAATREPTGPAAAPTQRAAANSSTGQ